MVQRSDDKGDKRSQSMSSDSGGASPDGETSAVKALRERIRQAGTATARASDHAPVSEELLVPHSSAPPASAIESSGVRTRPPEPRAISLTPPLFGAPVLKPNAMAVPWPAPPGTRNRALSKTRVGLGVPPTAAGGDEPLTEPDPIEPVHAEPDTLEVLMPPPRDGSASRAAGARGLPSAVERELAGDPVDDADFGDLADDDLESLALSTARTQPMPRVRGSGAPRSGPAPRSQRSPLSEAPLDPAEAERRRLELATTRKTQGLLRAQDAAGSHVGRYSVHDVSAEYVDTGVPEPVSPAEESGADAIFETEDETTSEIDLGANAELEGDSTRPRRSTPKQRVGHRRSTRPEVTHGRSERGTKRTDPGIRARTLRGGGSAAAPTPSPPPPLPAAPVIETSTVVVDPSLTWSPRPAPAPGKPAQRASSYVPLPRDREAYEAFLRSAAGEQGAPPRARPVWAQQETALIPREALESLSDADVDHGGPKRIRTVVGVLLILVSAVVLVHLFRADRSTRAVQVSPQGGAAQSAQGAPGSQPSAAQASPPAAPGPAHPITLISTEPSGAELLMGGAVIGNTPLEIARPAQGEELYMLRLRGFESQMVKLTAHSRETMHITMQPNVEPTRAAKR